MRQQRREESALATWRAVYVVARGSIAHVRHTASIAELALAAANDVVARVDGFLHHFTARWAATKALGCRHLEERHVVCAAQVSRQRLIGGAVESLMPRHAARCTHEVRAHWASDTRPPVAIAFFGSFEGCAARRVAAVDFVCDVGFYLRLLQLLVRL